LSAVDLVVRLDRRRDGLFGVASMLDSNGTEIFAHDNGRLQRRTTVPSFAGLVHQAGYSEALSSVLGR
jgi:hypothetical protein